MEKIELDQGAFKAQVRKINRDFAQQERQRFSFLRELCQYTYPWEIKRACRRITEREKPLQSNSIPTGYRIKNTSLLETGDFANLVKDITEYCCFHRFRAVAATELGLPINLIVFDTGDWVANLQVRANEGSGYFATIDGCGSLERSEYLTWYPKEVELAGIGSIAVERVAENHPNTASFILLHEYRHIQGKTSADVPGGILHPNELTEQDWIDIYNLMCQYNEEGNIFVRPKFNQVVAQTNDLERRGKILLYWYHILWEEDPDQMAYKVALPGKRLGKYQIISPSQMAAIIGKLL